MNRLKSYSSKKAAARSKSFLYSLFRLALLIAIGYLVIYPVSIYDFLLGKNSGWVS